MLAPAQGARRRFVLGAAIAAFGVAGLAGCSRSDDAPLLALDAAASEMRLHEVHPGSSDSAVVFIHGLDGTPIGTFFNRESNVSWPDLMKDDTEEFPGSEAPAPLAQWTIYTLDYRALYRSESNANEIAREIAVYLRTTDLFKKHNHVWFVAHSLGGIVLKRALLIYESERRELVLGRIAGIYFFGVPAHGSGLANLAADQRAVLLRKVIGKNYRVMQDLKPDAAAAFLGGLEEDWKDFLKRRSETRPNSPPFVHCAFEKNKILGVSMAVEQLYAQNCPGDNPVPVSQTHITMVKPKSKGSPVYLWVKGEIGADSRRIRQWKFFNWTPGLESLGTGLAKYQDLAQQPPDNSGLVRVPETIAYSDDAARDRAARLLLLNKEFGGPNVARLLDDVAAANRCVTVEATADRRSVTIAVGTDLKSCTVDGSTWYVCPGVLCPL